MSKERVTFTRQQIELLEQQFPEQIANVSTPEAAMRISAGQRSVVWFVKSRAAQFKGEPNGLAE
jgi:hypothetical protein